jgi:hypothetical protein
MIREAESEAAESFPIRESFVDCSGSTREFIIDISRGDDARFLTAVEATEEEGRYEFSAMSETDPYLALARLRQTIRRELSTRYLQPNSRRAELSHDVLKGRVGYGGVAVDGRFVTFADLVELIQTYEGFHVSLELIDPLRL